MTQSKLTKSEGFTLIEFAMALTIFSVGVLGTVATFGSLNNLGDQRELEVSRSTILRNAIATLQTVDYADVPASFGTGSGQESFWCRSDGSVVFTDPGDAIGVGQYILFVDESAIPTAFADLFLGFDLNGNGVIENGPVTDYRLLPVRITISLTEQGVVLAKSSDLLFRAW